MLIADPLAIRARRFRAVFVCGLQEGEFPRHPEPEPFLDDAARFSLARASGIVLPPQEDVLPRERYLLYAAVSRPEEVLFLSFRSSDEEGDPVQPSAFIDDVRALFTDELWERRGRRLLAEVTWPPGSAPTPHELRRARAAAEEQGAAAARRARERAGAGARSPRARPRRRAGWRRSRAAVCAGWSTACCARSPPTPIRSRCAAARSPTRCWSRRCGASRDRTDSPAPRPRCPRRWTRSRPRWTSCARGRAARVARAACASSRSTSAAPAP